MKNLIQTFFVVIAILSLLNQFGLVIKHNKLEVFHFSRLTKNINPSLLDLRPLENSILQPKDI